MKGLSFRQFLKYLAKVTVRLQSIQSGSLDQAVKIGAGFGASDGIGKEPIVAANHKRPDRPFNGIIVDVQPAIFAIDGQRRPLLLR